MASILMTLDNVGRSAISWLLTFILPLGIVLLFSVVLVLFLVLFCVFQGMDNWSLLHTICLWTTSGSSIMPRRGVPRSRTFFKTFHTWKRYARLLLAAWWRAAMALLALAARRRLRQ